MHQCAIIQQTSLIVEMNQLRWFKINRIFKGLVLVRNESKLSKVKKKQNMRRKGADRKLLLVVMEIIIFSDHSPNVGPITTNNEYLGIYNKYRPHLLV